MDRLIGDFCYDATEVRGVTDLTIKTYKYSLNGFVNFIEPKNINLINADKNTIRDYIGSLRKSGKRTKTIANHLAALASFYEYLVYAEIIKTNPVNAVKKRYATAYKNDGEKQNHKLISLIDSARLVDSAIDIRDRALILLLLKTGIRKNELISIDLEDIDWQNQSILLKPKKKRTNRVVFFDNETAEVLIRWMAARESRIRKKSNALFLTAQGRISSPAIDYIIRQVALRAGLHDIKSSRMEDHFSAHCCRHWNTTYLLRAGMKREYVQWLRGDAIKEAVDIYFHIDPKDVQEAYLASIPQLGI